jgi:tetratricopeptide (TPR) repeat protein
MKKELLSVFLALFAFSCGWHNENPPLILSPSLKESPQEPEGLDEYSKHLAFADRYLEEGDYEEALKELKMAAHYSGKKKDPLFYEIKGKVLDALGDTDEAFKCLKKAAWLYYERKDYNKAWQLLAWLNSLKPDSPEVKKLEKKLREEEI